MTNFDIFIQTGITVLSVAACMLSQSPLAYRRRRACIYGLAAQPFWFYATIHSAQFGMVLVCCLYTTIWARSFYLNWVKI